MKSTRWTVNVYDWLKGMIMFVGTPTLTLVQQEIPNWTDLLTKYLHSRSAAIIAQAALGSMVTYMLKQLGTDDTKQAVKTLTKQNVSIIENNPNQQ